jgi:hypothetical protein
MGSKNPISALFFANEFLKCFSCSTAPDTPNSFIKFGQQIQINNSNSTKSNLNLSSQHVPLMLINFPPPPRFHSYRREILPPIFTRDRGQNPYKDFYLKLLTYLLVGCCLIFLAENILIILGVLIKNASTNLTALNYPPT